MVDCIGRNNLCPDEIRLHPTTAGRTEADLTALLLGCTFSAVQVEVVLHAAGTPNNSRSLALTRQKVAINPVSHATCSGVPAAALPSGERVVGSTAGWFHAAFNSSVTA